MDKATKEAEALVDAVTDGAYVQLAGRKHSRQAKRRVWSCALLTRPLWLIVRSPISSASQWT